MSRHKTEQNGQSKSERARDCACAHTHAQFLYRQPSRQNAREAAAYTPSAVTCAPVPFESRRGCRSAAERSASAAAPYRSRLASHAWVRAVCASGARRLRVGCPPFARRVRAVCASGARRLRV
eukprot:1076197-Pleurochrysis_carterae.AAC.1